MTQYIFSYGIGFANATRRETIDDIAEYLGMSQEDFDALTDEEKRRDVGEAFDDWSSQFIDAAFWEVE